MDKNVLVKCITIFLCLSAMVSCQIHSQQKDNEEFEIAIESGLVQKMVKADGYDPEYIWVKNN